MSTSTSLLSADRDCPAPDLYGLFTNKVQAQVFMMEMVMSFTQEPLTAAQKNALRDDGFSNTMRDLSQHQQRAVTVATAHYAAAKNGFLNRLCPEEKIPETEEIDLLSAFQLTMNRLPLKQRHAVAAHMIDYAETKAANTVRKIRTGLVVAGIASLAALFCANDRRSSQPVPAPIKARSAQVK